MPIIGRAAPAPISIDALAARVGTEIGRSPWRCIAQADIDRFAAATDDRQFIHVDPARAAAETPFGGAVAHGFLTLSLLSAFAREALPEIAGRAMGINYGFDRVRFLAPVRSGARLRGIFILSECSRRTPTQVFLRHAATVEIEGGPKPALVADWLTLAVLATG